MLIMSALAREADKPSPKPSSKSAAQHKEPIPKKKNTSFGGILNTIFATALVVIVLLFAPTSFTYFFYPTHTSNLNDKAMALLVSPEFSYGKDSGHKDADGQFLILLRNWRAMVPHTMSGSVAIVLGLAQFSRTLQFKYPVVHRYIGRLYGLCAVIISSSSASFLFDTIPKKEVFSGPPFAMILSLLSMSITTTMAQALLAIRKGDIGSHREFMTLNYSLMLSAPALRVGWIILGNTWGETKAVVNLFSSLFAGPFLIGTSIFFLRRQYSRPANATLISSEFQLAVVAAGLAGLLFLAPKLSSFDQWSYRPEALFWTVVPQWIFQMITFTLLSERAKRRGDRRAYTAWKTYLNGMISAPAFAVISYYIARDVVGASDGAMGLCTVNGGWVLGLSFSYTIYVYATSTAANPKNRAVKAS